MKAIDIAIKDMTRSLRSAMALVFMFGVPILLTGMFYLMFGGLGQGQAFELPQTRVVFANLDAGSPAFRTADGFESLGALLLDGLQHPQVAGLISVSTVAGADEARQAVDRQEAQLALIVPGDFTRRYMQSGAQARLELYQDPTLTLSPGVIKAVLTPLLDSMSEIKISIAVAGSLGISGETVTAQIVQSVLEASEELQDSSLVKLQAVGGEQEQAGILAIVSPIMGGMMIFYAFYTGSATAQSILREDEEGTLPRLFTTPTPQSTILGGKFLAVFLTVIIQVTVLLLFGRFVFGIHWGQPAAVFLLVLGSVMSASTFGIFINSLLKSTKQAGVVFGGVLTMSGMIGMLPIFTMSAGGMSGLGETVPLLVPQGWAIRGLLQALQNQPLEQALTSMLVLLGWSVLFFMVGVWRFRRRYA